jgi:hypothetical protein
MMKTLSFHMQTNNEVSTNMGIVYVAPLQYKAGIPGAPKTSWSNIRYAQSKEMENII